jgi:hypothetical protein
MNAPVILRTKFTPYRWLSEASAPMKPRHPEVPGFLMSGSERPWPLDWVVLVL